MTFFGPSKTPKTWKTSSKTLKNLIFRHFCHFLCHSKVQKYDFRFPVFDPKKPQTCQTVQNVFFEVKWVLQMWHLVSSWPVIGQTWPLLGQNWKVQKLNCHNFGQNSKHDLQKLLKMTSRSKSDCPSSHLFLRNLKSQKTSKTAKNCKNWPVLEQNSQKLNTP